MKIVTLSTYPIENPRHGGQHRLLNLVRSLQASGHSVSAVGVMGAPHYPPSAGFLPRPPTTEFNHYIPNPLLMDDWALGELMALDDRYFPRLAALIPPDTEVLHIEQPWLFRFARRYVAERRTRPPLLIYGGQNVEHELKLRIVTNYLGEEHAKACAELVLECETDALRHADLVCAVSQEDAVWMQARTKTDVVLAANGANDRSASLDGIRLANKITGHRRFALYSASAHPPNVVGFFDMFGRGVGCFAPNQSLVVAGSAGSAIQGNDRFPKTPGLDRHFIASGEVDDDCLSALLQVAHAIVLPITQGGGTNLKTAEAIWAGHHIVATPLAMRGYEQFIGSLGVSVHSEPAEFRLAVREAMGQPALALTPDERERRRVVLWESTLMPLIKRVNELAD